MFGPLQEFKSQGQYLMRERADSDAVRSNIGDNILIFILLPGSILIVGLPWGAFAQQLALLQTLWFSHWISSNGNIL